MDEALSLEIVRSPTSSRQRIRPTSAADVQLRIAASRGKLYEVRTLLANGAIISKDSVSKVNRLNTVIIPSPSPVEWYERVTPRCKVGTYKRVKIFINIKML